MMVDQEIADSPARLEKIGEVTLGSCHLDQNLRDSGCRRIPCRIHPVRPEQGRWTERAVTCPSSPINRGLPELQRPRFRNRPALLPLLLAFLLSFGRSAAAAPQQGLSLIDEGEGCYRVEARQVPLLKVLAAVAGHTDVELFIAPSIEGDMVDISLPPRSVDKILTKLLRPYDFVASFAKSGGGEERMRLVKVYQRGKRGENLARVNPLAKTAQVGLARGDAARSGQTREAAPSSAPGAFLSGGQAVLHRSPETGEGRDAPQAALSRTLGAAHDLAELDLKHNQWKTLQAPVTMDSEAPRLAMTVEMGKAQQGQAVQRDALTANMERLEQLMKADGDTFSVTVP